MNPYTLTIDIGMGQTTERLVYGKTVAHAKQRLILARIYRGLKTKIVRSSQG